MDPDLSFLNRNIRQLLTLLRIALLKWRVSVKCKYFQKTGNTEKYSNYQHRISNSLNQTHKCPYKRNIIFPPCYAPNKLITHLVDTSKFKWQNCSQIYGITAVNFSSSTNVFIRLPNNSDVAWDCYVTHFRHDLWLAVAFTVCAISVCLALTNYGYERKQYLTLSTILFNIHACFCRQG
jgi:hypothetical protein